MKDKRELETINAELVQALERVTKRLEHMLKNVGISAPPSDVRFAREVLAKAKARGD